jgi:ABC-type dipeptide/oligopeptide/nickel transport system permease subunit
MSDIGIETAELLPANAAGTRFGWLRQIGHSKVAIFGTAILAFWIFVGIAAPWISPFPPNQTVRPMASPGALASNGAVFWFGTDHLGRDILARVIWGTRTVLVYAPLATALSFAVGVSGGLLAGYRRGWLDDLLSRLSDLVLAFPALVLYIIIVSKFGASGLNIVLAVTLASSPGIMRLTRGLTLALRDRAFVAAAQLRGEPAWRIMFIEILPNAAGPLIVDACLRLGYVVITIGTLGFLGLGLPPPDPDWGSMVNETRKFALVFPHMVLFPCLAVSSLVLGLNLLADGLRELVTQE